MARILLPVIFSILAIGLLFTSILSSNAYAQSSEIKKPLIPEWIKKNSEWYSQGIISEDDYIRGIEFLINNNIIKIKSNSNSRLAIGEEGVKETDLSGAKTVREAGATVRIPEKEFKPETSKRIAITEEGVKQSGNSALRTDCPGWWVWGFCFEPLPFDECKLELLDEIDDSVLCVPPGTSQPVHQIQTQYYDAIGKANIEMLQELRQLEGQSTTRTLWCPFDPDCLSGPTFPDPTPETARTNVQNATDADRTGRNPQTGKEIKSWIPSCSPADEDCDSHDTRVYGPGDAHYGNIILKIDDIIQKFEHEVKQAEKKRVDSLSELADKVKRKNGGLDIKIKTKDKD